MYVYYATSLFIQATIRYAISYSLQGAQSRLETALAKVEAELVKIGSHVGVGLDTRA